MKISDLYDGIADEFGIPAHALASEKDDVRDYLADLSKDQLEKIELHVRRCHEKLNKQSFFPTFIIISLRTITMKENVDLGSSILLPIHCINIKEI